MRGWVVVMLVASGCEPEMPPFVCATMAACTLAGRTGSCLPGGDGKTYCAFADSECGSGLRWHDSAAPELAGQCVVLPDGGSDAAVPVDQATADQTHVFTWTALASGTQNNLNGIWGSSPTDVYVVGAAGTILHSSDMGQTWVARAMKSNDLRAIWGSSSTDVYIAASQTLFHSADGAAWSIERTYQLDFYGTVWGSSGSDVYACDLDNVLMSGGSVLHYGGVSDDAGMAWSTVYQGVARGLWGSGPMDVYLVGDSGTIARSVTRGSTWAMQSSGVTGALRAVWGSGSGDIYVVGDAGIILHSIDSGSTWVSQPGATTELTGIWGASKQDVRVVGWSGTILRTADRGATWSPEDAQTTDHLFGIWGDGAGRAYVVGANGTILRGE